MLQTNSEVRELPGSERKISWVLSRCLVRQSLFEVADSLPESKRKSALALRVRKWSPFANTQFAAHWVGHRACVYAWDGTATSAAISAAGHDPGRCTVWPETFFRPPLHDGFRLCAMLDGVEGQVWRAGLLTATRWWPTPPSGRDWSIFLRSSGVDLTQAALSVPPVVQGELLPAPWTAATTPVTDLWSLVQNERAAAIAAAVVAVPFLYYLTQAIVLLAATMNVESAIAGMSAANQSVRNDRAAALANLDGIGSYLSLETLPPHFEVMSVATGLLQDKQVVISEWTFDAGSLSVVVQGTEPLEAPAFIELFERDDHFSEVSATVGNQQRELRLTMKVEPRVWPT